MLILGLHGHVEGGGRLIGDEEARATRDRHGDHRPLPHPARELVRIQTRSLVWFGNADQIQHLDRPRVRGVLREPFVDPGHLADLTPHPMHRVERGERILEDHRDLAATDLSHLVLGGGQQVSPTPHDLARFDPDGRGEPEDRHGRDGLSRARLADDGEHLAAVHVERHAVDRAHHALIGVEHGPKIAHREQRSVVFAGRGTVENRFERGHLISTSDRARRAVHRRPGRGRAR
jgi:hypothetical protein